MAFPIHLCEVQDRHCAGVSPVPVSAVQVACGVTVCKSLVPSAEFDSIKTVYINISCS